MKQTLHLRGDPHPGVTVAHPSHVHVTIPEFRWIDSLPRRSHEIVIEQAFRRRIREAGVKNPLLQGKVASSGDAEGRLRSKHEGKADDSLVRWLHGPAQL